MAVKSIAITVCLAVAFSSALAGPARLHGAEPEDRVHPKIGFELQKVDSRYERVARYYRPFRLPNTTMMFGPFAYDSPGYEEIGKPKWGFLRDSGRFFYLNEPFAQCSDAHYALAGEYLVVDGGPGVSRSMYIFKYSRDSMTLVVLRPPGPLPLSNCAGVWQPMVAGAAGS